MKLVIILVLSTAVLSANLKNQKVFETTYAKIHKIKSTIPLDQPTPSKMPQFISVDNAEYKATHKRIEYSEDSFTSVRSEQLKTEQSNQDMSLLKAIEHSKNIVSFLQIRQNQIDETMSEQEVQQALLTSEDYNNMPDIEMNAASNQEEVASEVNLDNQDEFYIPTVTEGDGSLEEVNDVDYTIQPEVEDIAMPNEQDLDTPMFLQMNNYY